MHPDIERFGQLLEEFEASDDATKIKAAFESKTTPNEDVISRLPEKAQERAREIMALRKKIADSVESPWQNQNIEEEAQKMHEGNFLRLLAALENNEAPDKLLLKHVITEYLAGDIEGTASKADAPTREKLLRSLTAAQLSQNFIEGVEEASELSKRHTDIDFGDQWIETFRQLISAGQWDDAYSMLTYWTDFSPAIVGTLQTLSEEEREYLVGIYLKDHNTVHPLEEGAYDTKYYRGVVIALIKGQNPPQLEPDPDEYEL